jgi:protein SCO1/2
MAGVTLSCLCAAQSSTPGLDKPAIDEHAHHHHMMESKPEIKQSMLDIKLAPIAMVRDDGRGTTLEKELAASHPTVLAFIYTSCTTVCPLTTQVLASVQDSLPSDLGHVRIMSISIDPEYDTPARLRAYAKGFGAKPLWRHYGGTLANSIALQKLFGAYRGDKMNHVPQIFINGGGKKGWLEIDGFPSAEEIIKQVREQIRS